MRKGAVDGAKLHLPLEPRGGVAEGVAARYRQLAAAVRRDRPRCGRRLYEDSRRGELLDVYLFIADRIFPARRKQRDAPRPRRGVGGESERRGECPLAGELRALRLPEPAAGREYLHRQREGFRSLAVCAAHDGLYRHLLAGAEDVPRRVAVGGITLIKPRAAGGVEVVIAVVEAPLKTDIGGVAILFRERDYRRAASLRLLQGDPDDAVFIRLSLADELVGP